MEGGAEFIQMMYELWAVNSGNRLAEFSSEASALDVVREIAAVDGVGSLGDLFLESYDEHGHWHHVAEGFGLAERAGMSESRS